MVIAIILAAGKSTRMKGVDKVTVEIFEKPLWKYSFDIFKKNKKIDEIYLIVNKNFKTKKRINCIKGGKTRFHSAKIAFQKIIQKKKLKEEDIIIFHNASNPLLTNEEINKVIQKAKKHGACILGNPAKDTIKVIKGHKVIKTLPREQILQAQTPQAFQAGLLKKAYKQKIQTTDEAALVELIGSKPFWIPASALNRKITTQEDLEFVRYILGEPICHRLSGIGISGIGSDSHSFDTQGVLTFGGVKIKNYPKLKANSDGDVILHAIATALSQAFSGGSLGTFADELCKKGIKKSTKYLQPFFKKMREQKFSITHIGVHIEGKKPKVDPLTEQLKKSLAKIFHILPEQIGITATSGEKLTPFGKGKGIHCSAIVNLTRRKPEGLAA